MNTRTQRLFVLIGFLACASLAPLSLAAEAPASPVPATQPADNGLMGERFESTAAGISFLPPGGCKMTVKPSADELVEYVSDEKSWILRVTRSQLESPTPLESGRDPKTNQQVRGLVDITVDHMIEGINPQILRKEIINVGEYDVGLVVARFSLGADRWLRQQAIFQVNDRLYYVFNLTTPTGHPDAAPTTQPGAAPAAAAAPDPKERVAVETFNAMLESIKLIDRTAIKEDQDERLYRTRALFLTWTPERFARIIQDKQYFLMERDGAPIGYSFLEEQPDQLDNNPGVNLYVRSRTFVNKNTQVEAASKMFTTFDLKHEKWAHVAVIKDGAGKVTDHSSEWGDSDYKQHRVFDSQIGVSDKTDAHQPKSLMVGSRALDVVFFGKKSTAPPFHQELPPFYITQAVGQLLPHLLPLNEQKTYAFACYVNETREVMFRYVDVSAVKELEFNGRRLRGVAISDRIGLEGPPTLHYFDFNGHYVGSENKSSKLLVLPVDAAAILRLWPDAILARSEETEHPPEDANPPGDPSANPARGMPAPIR